MFPVAFDQPQIPTWCDPEDLHVTLVEELVEVSKKSTGVDITAAELERHGVDPL